MKRSTGRDALKVTKRKITEKDNANPSGGLLKFGFTGAPTREPIASTVEFSQCPHCSGLFNSLSIIEHVERCYRPQGNSIDENASASTLDPLKSFVVQSNSNAFDIMKKSAAIKPPSTPSAMSMYFALLLIDDKLLPIFSTSPDYIDQIYIQCNTSSNCRKWSCDANVKKFRWHFDSSEPSHRPIVLHISTNIPQDTNVSFGDTASISTGWLKSMLQKAVRRKLHTKAIKLATMMCKSSTMGVSGSAVVNTSERNIPNVFNKSSRPVKSEPSTGPSSTASSNSSLLSELLRRLPIICLEDAALHPAYPIIIWLMVAVSKGYTPSRFFIDVVLLVTHDIAHCTYKDCTPPNGYNLCADTMNVDERGMSSSTPTRSSCGGSISDSLHTYARIENDSIRTLIACICIRASFGGMTGDMEMLDQYALLWYQRLVCGDKTTYTSGVASSDSNYSTIVIDSNAVTSVVDSNRCTTASTAIDCYLHPTYTTGLFTSTFDSVHWARQMYENFPATSVITTSLSSSKQEVTPALVVVDSDDECTRIITINVEQYLLHILQGASIPTTTNNTPVKTIPNYKPTPKLSTLLRMTPDDLVAEGLDHHCDWGLVPSILSTCSERAKQLTQQLETMSVSPAYPVTSESQNASDSMRSILTMLNDAGLENKIKSAIWLFRSANNSRKLYPLIGQNAHIEVNRAVFAYYQELVNSDLAQKRSLARLWGVVCPMIVAYCERKMTAVAHRL